MPHRVAFSPSASDDLRSLYLYIAEQSGEARALAYLERIEDYCRGFATFPERGRRRDDLLQGLRVIGFERRVTLAFHLDADAVIFDRILYGGRDLEAMFDEAGD
ncbi:MAG TPA: type II toxin-antitoxin system RelE/ParE family toxin [Caulobacteraceae bacterium]|nr:type II toxin-antitoxin system RelE/ParE family toxin [Caulobacteraceae bacterium]